MYQLIDVLFGLAAVLGVLDLVHQLRNSGTHYRQWYGDCGPGVNRSRGQPAVNCGSAFEMWGLPVAVNRAVKCGQAAVKWFFRAYR